MKLIHKGIAERGAFVVRALRFTGPTYINQTVRREVKEAMI